MHYPTVELDWRIRHPLYVCNELCFSSPLQASIALLDQASALSDSGWERQTMFGHRENRSSRLYRYAANASWSRHCPSCPLRVTSTIIEQRAIQISCACSALWRSVKSPLPLLSTLYHSPTTLLASPIDQRVYKSLLGLEHLDVFDRWIQTHQLVPVAKPDLVYLQVKLVLHRTE